MSPIVPPNNQQTKNTEETSDVVKPDAEERDERFEFGSEENDAEDARENLGGDAVDLLEAPGQGFGNKETAGAYELPGLTFALDGPETEEPVGDAKPVKPALEKPKETGPALDQQRPGEKISPEAEISPAEKLKAFDAKYDHVLKLLDQEIETERVGLELMSGVLKKARTESLELRLKTGNSLAIEEAATEAGDKPKLEAEAKQLAELKRLDKTSESNERKIFEHLPDATKARGLKAAVQIASGKDDQIQKGELEFCKLVRENPQLVTNQQFRNLVMRSYAEMAAARELRGLGDWQPKVKVEDVLGSKPEASTKRDPIQLLSRANELFFQDGIEKATPLFKEAVDAQKSINQEIDRKRLGLFIEGLGQDSRIAQDANEGEEVDRLIAKRLAHKDLEQKAAEESLAGRDMDASLRMNFAFARIATGNPELFNAAMLDLNECLENNPAMSFDEGFQNSARQAFKAHAQNKKAFEESVAKGEKEQPKPLYKDLDLKKLAVNETAMTDARVESYAVDDVTGPALLALGLGLALAQYSRTRSKQHTAAVMKEGLSAASEVKGIENLPADTRAERQAKSGDTAKFEIKGTARDGRLVLARDLTASPLPENAPVDFKEIRPGKSFNPDKFQFDQYTPVSVNGKQYFADRDGRTYKLEHKIFSEPRLFEDQETRQIELVPPKQLQALLPEIKVVPEALEMTHEHPEKAMPREWQKEFEFIRDVKRALVENDKHSSSRLESLDRAVKGLNDTTYSDRQKYAAELTRQLQQVGINVEYSDQPGTDGRNVKVVISEPGSDRRLVIFGDRDKAPLLESKDKEGKFTVTEPGRVKVADQLAQLERVVSKNLKESGTKEKLQATDPELDRDASNKEVRRSFVDGLPKSWREAHAQTQKFSEVLRQPEAGLKAAVSTMLTELAKAPPEVMSRALDQVAREFKAIGLDAGVELSKAEGGKTRATLSVLAPDGKTKLLFYSDGSKPALEPNSVFLPGVVVKDDASFDKAMEAVSKRAKDVASGKFDGITPGAAKSPTGDHGEASHSKTDAPAPSAQEIAKVKAQAELLIDDSKIKPELKDAYKRGIADGYLTPEAAIKIFSGDQVTRELLFDSIFDPKLAARPLTREGFAALVAMREQSLNNVVNHLTAPDLKLCMKALDDKTLTTKAMEGLVDCPDKAPVKERSVWLDHLRRCMDGKETTISKGNLQKILELSPSARATFLPGGAFDTALKSGRIKGDVLTDILDFSKNPDVYLKLDADTRTSLLILDKDARHSIEQLLARPDVDEALVKKIMNQNSGMEVHGDVTSAYYGTLVRNIITADQLNKILDLDKPTRDAFNKLLIDQHGTSRNQALTSPTIDLLLQSKPTPELLELYRQNLEGPNNTKALLSESRLVSLLQSSTDNRRIYTEFLKNQSLDAESLEKLLAVAPSHDSLKTYQKALSDKVLSPEELKTLLSMPDEKRAVFEKHFLPGQLKLPPVLESALFGELLKCDQSAGAMAGFNKALSDGMSPDVLEKVMKLDSPTRELIGKSLNSGELIQEHLSALIAADTKLDAKAMTQYAELVREFRGSNLAVADVTRTAALIQKTAAGSKLSPTEAFETAAIMRFNKGADVTEQSVVETLKAMERVKSVRTETKLAEGGLREALNIIQVKDLLALDSYTAAKSVSDVAMHLKANYRSLIFSHPHPDALALNMALVMRKNDLTMESASEDATNEEYKRIAETNKAVFELAFETADPLTRVREQNRNISFEQAGAAADLLRGIGGEQAALELAREIMLRGPADQAGMQKFLIDYATQKEKSESAKSEKESRSKPWKMFRETVMSGDAVGKAVTVVTANSMKDHATLLHLAKTLTAGEIASIPEARNLVRLLDCATEESSRSRDATAVDALQRKMIEGMLQRYVNRLTPEISPATISRLLEGIPEADRARAVDYLKARVDYTSKPAARQQFREIQNSLARAGCVSETTNQPGSHGMKGEMIRAYCLSSDGEALAQEFRKATGLAVEIVRPGDVIPKGSKVVLFDSPSKAKATEVKSNVIATKDQMVLTGDLKQLQQLTTDGTVHADKYLTSYNDGLNARDLAAMKGNPNLAIDKVLKAIGSTAGDTTKANPPPAEKQVREVHEALNKPIEQRRSEMVALGKEHLLPVDYSRKSGYEYLQRTMLETARAALNPNIIDGERMVHQARLLHAKILEKAGVAPGDPLPKNVVFVALNRNQGKEMWADSAHKALQIYREANGLTDAKYDQHYLTPEQLRDRMVTAARTGEKLIVFALNDSTNTGGEAKDIIDRMTKMKAETRASNAEVRYATFMGYEGGIEHATSKSGADSIITGDAPIKKGFEAETELRVVEGISDEVRTRLASKQSRYVRFTTEAVHEDGYSISLPNSQSELLDAMDHPRWQSERRLNERRYDATEWAQRRESERVQNPDTANVGRVNDNLMRGGKPYTEEAIMELRAKGVTVIVDLTTHGSEQERKWCAEYGIEYVHIPLTVSRLTADEVADAAKDIQRLVGQGKNVYVHCIHGKDRTGAVMAKMRMDSGWTSADALTEMEAYGITPGHAKKLYSLAGEDITRGAVSSDPGVTVSDTTPTAPRSEAAETRAGSVPQYTELPKTADREVAEINERVKEVFKGVTAEQFKAMDATKRQQLIDTAVERIMPLMQQYAKRLGLPADLIKPGSITFDALTGSSGLYTLKNDRIVLDINLEFPANTAFHELVHKMRALDLKAAFKADPAGARLALMDRILSDGSARIRVGSEIVERRQFKDPKVAAEYRQVVEHHILKRLHKDGLIEASQVPPAKPYSFELLREFGHLEAELVRAAANEVGNFVEACDLVENSKLAPESTEYVERKAKAYRSWIENPKGTSVVRLAVHEVLQGELGKGTQAEQIKAIQERVALMTAEMKGDPKTGVQVSDDLVKDVMERYARSDPKVEAVLARSSASLYATDGIARAEFDPTPRSLRANPYVAKLLMTASIDRVARVKGGEPEYSFSNEELAARKGDIAERAKRLNREMKTTEMDPHKLADAQKAFAEFVDYLKLASEQQRLNNALATDNFADARALALKMQDKMAGNVEYNRNYIDFLLLNRLIKPEELNEAFRDFDRVGGRARAISMDRFARGAIKPGDGIRRIEKGATHTDYILSEPLKLFAGTESEVKMQSIRAHKDGSITVAYTGADGRLHVDPIEHHWPGQIDPSRESEFSRDFKKVADAQKGEPVEKRVALFVDYLKQLESGETKPVGEATAADRANYRDARREGDAEKESKRAQPALDALKKILATEAPGLDLTKMSDQAFKSFIEQLTDQLKPAEKAQIESLLKNLDKTAPAMKGYLSGGGSDALARLDGAEPAAAETPGTSKSRTRESLSARTTEAQTVAAEARPFDYAKAQELRKTGELFKTFVAEGMEERRARALEEKLTSADPKERESALVELDKYFEARVAAEQQGSGTKNGGRGPAEKRMRGWEHFKTKFGENKGRIATLIIVLGPTLPYLISKANETEGSFSGTGFSK
jgi:protein tyrosine phosphatase (PTP) superfamily phosphohydrolase (DUF442 family)